MDTAHQKMFHSQHHAARHDLLQQLRGAHTELCNKQAERIDRCGRGAAIFKDQEGFLIIATARCKSRLCPTCQETRSNRIWARLKAMIETIDEVRLITLTLAPRDTPLKDQVKELRDAWSKLRRRKEFKNKLKGGVAVVEVTHNASTDKWHPHLHIVYEGIYIKHSILKAKWLEITKDSSIVDIRMIPSRMQAVNYLAKYVSKTASLPKSAKHRIAEWVQATAALREYATFGGMHAKIEQEVKESRELQHVMFLNQLAEGARSGHKGCAGAYSRLMHLPPKDADPNINAIALATHAEAWNYALEQFGYYLHKLNQSPGDQPGRQRPWLTSKRAKSDAVLWL